NALAMALIMTIPLMAYLTTTLRHRWQRWIGYGVIACTGMSVLGSHSRGAALATACMLMVLTAKSRNKLKIVLALLLLVPVGVAFMPSHWFERMVTVRTYEEDTSAMGRITAWKFAIDVATQRAIG